MDDMFNELQLRGLRAIDEEDNIIDLDMAKITRNLSYRQLKIAIKKRDDSLSRPVLLVLNELYAEAFIDICAIV